MHQAKDEMAFQTIGRHPLYACLFPSADLPLSPQMLILL